MPPVHSPVIVKKKKTTLVTGAKNRELAVVMFKTGAREKAEQSFSGNNTDFFH